MIPFLLALRFGLKFRMETFKSKFNQRLLHNFKLRSLIKVKKYFCSISNKLL